MMKVILILAAIIFVSSAELDEKRLMTELKELEQELRNQAKAEAGKTTVEEPEVAVVLPKVTAIVGVRPTGDLEKGGEDTQEVEEEEVKVSSLEKIFSKLGNVLGKRIRTVAKRYEKKARKVRKIANLISTELDLIEEETAIQNLASRFEDAAKFLRQIADETEMYFDGADKKLQNIMSRAPSNRHIFHLRKKVKAVKKAGKLPQKNKVKEPSNAKPDNTDTAAAVNDTESGATKDKTRTDTTAKSFGAKREEADADVDVGSKRSFDWLVNELRGD